MENTFYKQSIYTILPIHDKNIRDNKVFEDGVITKSVRVMYPALNQIIYFNVVVDDITKTCPIFEVREGWSAIKIKQHKKYSVTVYDVVTKTRRPVALSGNSLINYITQFNEQHKRKEEHIEKVAEYEKPSPENNSSKSSFTKPNW